ncbi:MAG: hypothetical protein AAB401_14095 [Acidobacteriota bacterium]
MFTVKSENQNVISKLILSEASLGVFGVAVLVVMLAFAFVGMATETTGRQNVKAPKSKSAASGLVARNMKTIG